MTTVFLVTLRPILMLSKSIGLIDISYTVGSTGLLVRNKNSRFQKILEIVRMVVLFTLTYLYWPNFNSTIHILQVIDIIKFLDDHHRSQTINNMDNQVVFIIIMLKLLNKILYSFVYFNCKYVI